MMIESEDEAEPLAGIRVVDQHCHISPGASGRMTKEVFTRLMSLESYNPEYVLGHELLDGYQKGSMPVRSNLDQQDCVHELLSSSQRSGETTLFFKESIKALAKFLGVPTANLDDVLRARNERAASDYAIYAAKLYAEAEVGTMIASDYPYLPYTDPSTYDGVTLKHKLVLPALIFNCLDEESSFTDASKRFISVIEESLNRKGFVGVKSMIAYGGPRHGSGLDIGNPSEASASTEFTLYKERRGSVEGRQIKNLLDYFHRLAIREASEAHRPFEFHTGIGDTEVLPHGCNPILLVGLLQDEEVRRAKIILLHGGYPYVAEAGWIAHFFPNVYLDSSIVYFTHFNAAVRRVEEMLEMAPYSKLLYSSDGMIPELQWFAARFAKRVMSRVLGRMVSSGTLNESEATDLAESYFHGNAQVLYRLS